MSARIATSLAPALLLLLAAVPARAEVMPELELASGALYPMGDARYADRYARSLILGVRGVAFLRSFGADARWRLGAELAVDGVDLAWDAEPSIGMYRVRGLAGARLEYRLTPRLQLFTRALAGIDHYRSEAIVFQAPGEPTGLQSFTDSGSTLALELGVGARFTLGHFVLGAQCGLPVAFYDYDRSPSSGPGQVLHGGVDHPVGGPATFAGFIHSTTVDLDALLTLGVAF